MLITIVVAAYNVERYIEKCLCSICCQTYDDIQIICVNDGSTDSTYEIIKKIAGNDSRVEIINQKNQGLSAARNAGMNRAKGDFIMFVDGDDELLYGAVEKIVGCISSDVDAVWFEPEIVYLCHKELMKSDEKYYTVPYSGKVKITDDYLLIGNVNTWTKAYRLSVIRNFGVNYPVGLYYEDAAFFYNLFSVLQNVYFLKEKLYRYYRRPSSIMSETFEKSTNKALHHIFILDDIYRFWVLNDLLRFRKYYFESICLNYFKQAMKFLPESLFDQCIDEMRNRLRDWNLNCEYSQTLRRIKTGENKNRSVKVRLKGLENIFSIKNENGIKVVRLFTMKIFLFKK